jgi:dUTP pyrophosphatase
MPVFFKKLDPKASLPSRNNVSDAGADLRSIESIIIPPLSRALINTGLSLEIPYGFYGRIAPRSGLAVKYGIDVLAGVVDSSYRGPLGVVLYNTDKEKEFVVNVGDRIAQIIFEQHWNFKMEEVSELSDTSRSNNGFGSSGIK